MDKSEIALQLALKAIDKGMFSPKQVNDEGTGKFVFTLYNQILSGLDLSPVAGEKRS